MFNNKYTFTECGQCVHNVVLFTDLLSYDQHKGVTFVVCDSNAKHANSDKFVCRKYDFSFSLDGFFERASDI
jgi:hypothetical protein